MKVLILAKHPKWGSNVIRGKTMSKYLTKTGITTSNISFKKFKRFKWFYLKRYNIFLFIKHVNLDMIKELKQRGKTIIVDTIDNFDFENDPLWAKENDFVDYYIANTKDHMEYLHKRFHIDKKRLFVIDHHHSNIDNLTKKINYIHSIGYIGEKEQFSYSDKLKSFCIENEIELYISKDSPKTRKKAVNEVMKLDCFIMNINRDMKRGSKNIFEFILKFKPGTKTLLPFSLGTPTVFPPYSSIIDGIKEANYDNKDFLIANNEDEVIQALQKLIRFSPDQRQELIRKQKEVAQLFTIENIVEKYIDMFNTIEKNG